MNIECDLNFSTNISAKFLILERTELDVTVNVYWYSCTVFVILVRF